jgi:hypothetical protein
MTIIPRNKQLRAILGGCAALSAVMAGPMLVDASAQAQPQSSCLPGGVCLTSTAGTVTTTETTTVPTTVTTTTSIPFTTTVPVTVTVPTTTTTTATTTVPTTTTTTTTMPVTTTSTKTSTITSTVTMPVTTTSTLTQTITSPSTTTETVTTTITTRRTRKWYGPDVRAGADTASTTSATCMPPGSTMSIGTNQVETCSPGTGQVAVYATTPGVYSSIFDNDATYYVSAGIFAPQYAFGRIVGCYYVPDTASVTAPGQTTDVTAGVLTDAVAFGLHSGEISRPRRVPSSDCGGGLMTVTTGS